MKMLARKLLFLVWILGILMPSVVTLAGDNQIIIVNLNEEEQQEHAKKIQVEEDIINTNPGVLFSLIAQSKRWISLIHKSLIHNDFNLEILLPPPESKS